MNLASVVRINAANLGGKAAILHGDDTITYAEAWRSILGVAATLHAAGIGAGDRVGLAMQELASQVKFDDSLVAYLLAVFGAWVSIQRTGSSPIHSNS